MIAWCPRRNGMSDTARGITSNTTDATTSTEGFDGNVVVEGTLEVFHEIDRVALMRALRIDDAPQSPEDIRAGWRERRRAMRPTRHTGRQFLPRQRLRQYQVSRR